MNVVGFCTIKKDAPCTHAMGEPKDWQYQDCRVLEFDKWGGLLAVHPSGELMGMFDKEEIYRKFECEILGDVILPPGLNELEKIIYAGKVHLRKGGYNNLLRNMVIEASLMKQKFNDSFLFAKQ